MRILLIGNYELDGQQSMLCYLAVLNKELQALGHDVVVFKPKMFLGSISFDVKFLRKWFGYFDKIFMTSLVLLNKRRSFDVVHVLDHSNAFYMFFLHKKNTLVTCHDVIAINVAKGNVPEWQASFFGKFFQKMILCGLSTAKIIVSVSKYTEGELQRVLPALNENRIFRIVYNGLNYPYTSLSASESKSFYSQENFKDLVNTSYLLHVGNNSPRKNRETVIRVFSDIRKTWKGRLVLVGGPLSSKLAALAVELGVEKDITIYSLLDSQALQFLYTNAFALFFPSRYEGFGWPLIEAQACACPVICSDCGPFPEIVLETALIAPVDDLASFVICFKKLLNSDFRTEIIRKGLENSKRFSARKMALGYEACYEELLNKS